MLRPEYFEGKADRILELYERLENFILRDIARRILKSGKITATADRLLYRLEQLGESRDEVQRRIIELTDLSEKELRKLLRGAVLTSWEDDAVTLSEMGIAAQSPLENARYMAVIEAEYIKSRAELKNLTRTTLEQSQKDLVALLDEADVRVASGVQSYPAAIADVLDAYAGRGVMVDYPTGTRRTLESAVRCCVVTSMNQTAAQLTNRYIVDSGTEYVLTSAHLGARVRRDGQPLLAGHDEWQGRVFKIDGSEPGYPNLLESTGYDIDLTTGEGRVVDMRGMHGYNCRHGHMLFDKRMRNPWRDAEGNLLDGSGNKITDAENLKRYEDSQKQRAMERGIRKTKRQLIVKQEELAWASGAEREKLQQEYKELEERIAYYQRVLADPELVKSILKEELTAIRDKYGDDRVTEIQDVEDELDIEDLIEEEQCVFTLTENGYIKRTPVSEYAAQSKGGMGKKGITTREEDTVVDVFTASTHDYILFFTDTGKVYRKKGYQIPESGKAAKGVNIVNIIQVETGERVQAMLHFRETGDEELYLFMTTRNGTVKRLEVSALKNLRNNGIRALTLDEGDQLISVTETRGHDRMLIATHDGQAVCFDETDVRAMGRTAVGVRGIRLREGDYVIGAARADADKTVLSITENGYGKRTPIEEYRITNRGGMGIRNYMVTDKTGPVVGMKVVDGTEDLLLVTAAGILIRTPVENIRVAGRATQGVIVMRFKEEGDRVISLALADPEEKEQPASEEAPL